MSKEVENWWEQAQIDLQNAYSNLENKAYYVAVFLAQQSAEKALKALYLKEKEANFPRTHDLTTLCNLLKAPKNIHSHAQMLTPAYVLTRYPDMSETIPAHLYSQAQTKDLLKAANEVLKWIKEKLEP